MRKGERKYEIIRLRAKGEFLAVVTAKDDKVAIKVAITQYELTPAEAKQLIARPWQ